MHGWNPSCPSYFVIRKGKCVRKNTWNPGVMGWSLLGLGLFLLLFTGFSDTSFSAECDHHQPRLGQVTLYLSLVGNGLNLQPPQKPAKLSHFDSLGGGSSLNFGGFLLWTTDPWVHPFSSRVHPLPCKCHAWSTNQKLATFQKLCRARIKQAMVPQFRVWWMPICPFLRF